MKWQIVSLAVSLSFLITISHYHYGTKQSIDSDLFMKNLSIGYKNALSQNISLLRLCFKAKSKEILNLDQINAIRNVIEENQITPVKILASVSLIFKWTTGFFFFRSFFAMVVHQS